MFLPPFCPYLWFSSFSLCLSAAPDMPVYQPPTCQNYLGQWNFCFLHAVISNMHGGPGSWQDHYPLITHCICIRPCTCQHGDGGHGMGTAVWGLHLHGARMLTCQWETDGRCRLGGCRGGNEWTVSPISKDIYWCRPVNTISKCLSADIKWMTKYLDRVNK